ncbi:hypothetical protein LR48_Vigan04g159700 [Vigna angularis]|uniref:Uncharacterized protein n=1 Tax=Phaseolus angularis TaxID=3914 RepID=A0A0L9UFS1_PHAAN|nr:hypothetical protein LR48_Vigan04g159700 [Vigna angularis]
MLSVRAFAQRMGSLCEWFERIAFSALYECLGSLSHCLGLSYSDLGRHARGLGLIQLEVIRIASLTVVRMVPNDESLSEDSHSELGRYARYLWIRSTNVFAVRMVQV